MPVLQRSSASRPVEAGTAGLTGTRVPVRIQARWLGANRGASNPSLISRVTAKRLNVVAGGKRRGLSGKPSGEGSTSPSAARMEPAPVLAPRGTPDRESGGGGKRGELGGWRII